MSILTYTKYKVIGYHEKHSSPTHTLTLEREGKIADMEVPKAKLQEYELDLLMETDTRIGIAFSPEGRIMDIKLL